MSETVGMRPITQGEYVSAEADHLRRMLDAGQLGAAATSIQTLRQELHLLELTLADRGVDFDNVCGRVTTMNGRYYRWPVLDEIAE